MHGKLAAIKLEICIISLAMFFSTCSMSDTGCLERNLILNRFVDVLCKILKLYVFVNFTGTYANHTTKNDV